MHRSAQSTLDRIVPGGATVLDVEHHFEPRSKATWTDTTPAPPVSALLHPEQPFDEQQAFDPGTAVIVTVDRDGHGAHDFVQVPLRVGTDGLLLPPTRPGNR